MSAPGKLLTAWLTAGSSSEMEGSLTLAGAAPGWRLPVFMARTICARL